MDWLGFWHYMFAPEGQPFYTGAFWSNQVQWTVVTLPVMIWGFIKFERKQQQRHEDLKQHITETHTNGQL